MPFHSIQYNHAETVAQNNFLFTNRISKPYPPHSDSQIQNGIWIKFLEIIFSILKTRRLEWKAKEKVCKIECTYNIFKKKPYTEFVHTIQIHSKIIFCGILNECGDKFPSSNYYQRRLYILDFRYLLKTLTIFLPFPLMKILQFTKMCETNIRFEFSMSRE